MLKRRHHVFVLSLSRCNDSNYNRSGHFAIGMMYMYVPAVRGQRTKTKHAHVQHIYLNSTCTRVYTEHVDKLYTCNGRLPT